MDPDLKHCKNQCGWHACGGLVHHVDELRLSAYKQYDSASVITGSSFKNKSKAFGLPGLLICNYFRQN